MTIRRWTREDRSVIDTMIADGERYETIAERLGTTRQAIAAQCAYWNINHATACDLLSGMDVARLMGVSKKSVYAWARRGWLVPASRGYRQRFRRQDVDNLVRNVDSWIAWTPDAIADDVLRTLAIKARANGPLWLTTHEVAVRYSVTHECVGAWIRKGLLPASQYCVYYVRSDHLAGFVAPCMKGGK